MTDSITGTLIIAPAPGLLPARLFAPTPKAARRVVEFFTAQINNDHTRKAYVNAARRFAEWCEAHGLHELAQVQPFHKRSYGDRRLPGLIRSEPSITHRGGTDAPQYPPCFHRANRK